MVTTTDKLVMEVDVKKSMVDLDKLHKKIESITGGVARLVASKEIPTKGIVRYRYEIEKTTRSMKELSKVSDKVQNSYRKNVTRVTTQFKKGKNVPIPETSTITKSARGTIQNVVPLGKSEFLPSVKKEILNELKSQFASGADLMREVPRAVTQYNKPIGPSPQTFQYPQPIGPQLPKGTTQYKYPIGPRPPKNIYQYAEPIGPQQPKPTLQYKQPLGPKQPQKKVETRLEKFSKGLRNATKQVFMMQMGMLGVSFSSQALVASLQGLGMSALTGLADTETAIKNMVISDVFGGTDILNDINLDEFVDNSLKAQGAVGGLSTILVQIANKVFSDPATADKIANALTQVVNKLTEPEFIDAVLGIVDAITNPDFVKSMTDAALRIANLINVLGENGLLDDIISLMVACQFLMPVFAALQLLFISLGSTTLLYLIAAIIVVGSVVMALVAGINEWGKSGNILLDVINVVITAFIKLWETMLYLPTVVFDIINSVISELTGGLINLTNPFKAFTDTMWGFKDLLNTTFSGNKENYDTGTHSYTNITNNYNAPITIPKTSVQPIR